ncbi:MAG: hypothetical protein EPO28_03190 [Saprospiraceae bacterium]|nr:MAG: hypothetical protein EPO28_03190 [Saprospiraceae bacterium]
MCHKNLITTHRRVGSLVKHAASLLFFSLLFFSFSGRVNAQSSNFGIEVCRVMSGSPAGSDAQCLAPGCFRYYYEFMVIPNGGQGDFVFDNLDISAQLTVNGITLVTNPAAGLLSEINPVATNGCYNPLFNDNLLPTAEEVSFILSNDDNNPATNDPPITIPAGQMPFHLFTLVVDAFPGETIDLIENAMYSYQTSMGNEMPVFEACQGTFVATGVTFPEPAACASSGPCIEFGQVAGGGNIPAVIPVNLTNGASAIEEIDIKIDVAFNNLVEIPAIIGGDIAAANVEVFMNSSGGYTIYAHQRDITNATGFLFRIQINGPVFISNGGTATLTMENARYAPLNGTCCKPCLDAPEQVVFTGYPDCTEDVTARVDAISVQQGGQCSEILLNVSLNWTGPPSTRDFYKLTLVCDLETSGGVTIVGLGAQDFACPGSQNYCGGSTCFEILDANTFRYCFWSINPVSITNNTGFQVRLDVPSGCVENVVFRETYIDLTGGGIGVACVPARFVDAADFPICSPMIQGETLKENGDEVQGSYSIGITGPACNYTLDQNCESLYARCVCNDNGTYTVTPAKNDFPLCGVTTFDLVLISRHILDIQPLNSPYKIIAADVNHSNSVTTFDLVEIRRLILHINETFPNNTSWRFVDRAYQFPDPADPFMEQFPEFVNATVPPGLANFVAIKIGDVNLSCTSGCLAGPADVPEERMAGLRQLLVKDGALAAGETVTIPFSWGSEEPLAAFQAGIRFDADAVEFIGPSKGQVEGLNKENFGLTQVDEGVIRTLWFSPDGERGLAHKGTILFNLSYKAKKDLIGLAGVLHLDDAMLNNLAFDTEGREYPLELTVVKSRAEGSPVTTLQVWCRPNPFSHELSFDIETDKASKGSIWLFSAFGVRLYYKEIELTKGSNTFKLDQGTFLPKGILAWQVMTPHGKVFGNVIKQ